MKRMLLFLLASACLPFAAGSVDGKEAATEVLLKTCFPNEDRPAASKAEKCKNEDCGLRDEVMREKSPKVEKSQQYSFLGGTDLGIIWGATHYQVIGVDRVRFLIYIVPTVTTKTEYYVEGTEWIPTRMIRTAFYSSFGEYQGSAVTTSYAKAEKKVVRRQETIGGHPQLQMVDLHCGVRKIKIYDNQTIYFRTAGDASRDERCVELLWEKPDEPLPWHPVSTMTIDILSDYYCREGRQSGR